MDTSTTSSQTIRPLASWLKAAGRHLSAATDQALFAEGSNRREWRMLNLIDGTAPGTKPGRMPRPGRAQILIDRGWAAWSDDGLALTDRGRAAKERLGAAVAEVREQGAAGITDDDYETTVRTLEQIARNLGWTEDAPLPRGRRGHGRRRGFGSRGRGHGFGHGHRHGFGHGRGFGHESARDHRGRGGYDRDFRHDRGFGHGRHGFDHEFTRDHRGHGHDRHWRGHHAHAAHDCTARHTAGEHDA